MTRIFAVLAFVLATLFAAPAAEACSCLPPSIQSSYNFSDHVFSGRILRERTFGQWVVYDIRVTRDGKSCQTTGDIVQVATPVSGATCGTRFTLGTHMLIFGQTTNINGVRRITTNSCAGNRRVNSLTTDEIDWLRARYVPCTGACLDPTIPVYSCLIDPCTIAPPCPGATCTANYCGGCNAEWYDSNGYQQCVP